MVIQPSVVVCPLTLNPQYGVEGGALPELYLGPNRGTRDSSSR